MPLVDDLVLASAPERGPDAAAPRPYDFGRPAALSREHARALAGAFEAFARNWATQLTSKIRVRAHIAVERISLETYDEYAATLPATTLLVVCARGTADDRAIVEFPVPTALSWIAKMVGGDASPALDGRALTALELALLRALMDDTLAHLRTALGGLLAEPLTVAAVQYNAAFAQIASAQDLFVVVRFSLRLGDRTEQASIALPAASVLERLSRSSSATPESSDPAVLRAQVEETPVELTLRLAAKAVRPIDVLGLSVGDVLSLPHAQSRPLDLVIGDHVVAAAAVGTNGARLACVVTSAPSPTSLPSEST